MKKLWNKLMMLLGKYREVVLYVFFGGCTTLINLAVYWVLRNILKMGIVPADVIAWIMAVLFAYVTNKIWVFESKTNKAADILKEVISFFAARLFSLGFEVVFLLITVEHFGWNDIIMKLIANIAVIVMNYVFSKLLIFRKKSKNDSEEEQ